MKKSRNILLAGAMALSALTTVPATCLTSITSVFADTQTYTVKIKETAAGHTFSAYQIFDGDLASDGTLSNIVWSTTNISLTRSVPSEVEGGDPTTVNLIDEIKQTTIGSAQPFGECSSAAQVAEVLAGTSSDNNATAKAFASVVAKYVTGTPATSTYTPAVKDADGTITTAAYYTIPVSKDNPGYYLIVDSTTLSDDDDASSSYILEVCGDATVEVKKTVPTVDKKVEDGTSENHSSTKTSTQDAIVDGFGESADHQIGEEFQFKLTATIVNDEEFQQYDAYKIVFKDTLSKGITFDRIDSITVDNTEVYVKPTVDELASGEKTVIPTEDDADEDANFYYSTGSGSDDSSTLDITIADLKDYVNTTSGTITVTVLYTAHLNPDAEVSSASTTGLNKNNVYLQYSTQPYVEGGGELGSTTDDNVWVFTYRLDNTKVNKSKEKLGGAVFQIRTEANNENSAIKVKWDSDQDAYVPDTTGDKNFTSIDPKDDSDNAGSLSIAGLDAGTYYLVEITAPEGYNKLSAPVTITISAEHRETDDGKSATLTLTEDSKTAMKQDIENNPGSSLPGTGGMGTTIFYTVGGILVVGAGVLMVTSKRMKREN